jgi:hypothetical protein
VFAASGGRLVLDYSDWLFLVLCNCGNNNKKMVLFSVLKKKMLERKFLEYFLELQLEN